MNTTDCARAYLARVPGDDKGGRNNATFVAGCKLVEHFDLPENVQFDLLLDWSRRANNPPLPDADVRSCLRSARKKTRFDPAKANGAPTGPARARRPLEARQAPPPAEDTPTAPLPSAEELDAARRWLCDNESQAAIKARDYLAACGISPAACGWGLGHLTAPQAHECGLPASAAGFRLLVPVCQLDGTLADVRRYRGPFGPEVEGDKLLPWAKGHGTAKPYRFDRLAPDDAQVVWAEGEKDAEALAAARFAAVANTCGAGSAAKVARELPDERLAGRRFVLLFDHDQAGRDGAGKLAEVLAQRGATVAVATWPDTLPDGTPTPEGFDASDWFAAGYPREELQTMLDGAPLFDLPDEEPQGARQNGAGGAAGLAEGEEAEEADLPDVGHCAPGRHGQDDIGNAERFASLCGARFRYCWDWQTWLVYDGMRWAIDTAGAAITAARAVARSILREAYDAPDHQRDSLTKHARSTAKRAQLEAMLYLARSDLAVLSKGLDTDPLLLNCANGTVDLRTGHLRPHSPADMLTRCTTSAYVPGADLAETPGAAEWRNFLAAITNADAELAAYLQRAAGYSVTGDPCEEVLFFAYGSERTGKSTFLATIGHHLADYGDQVDFTAFLRKRDDSELKPELAKLQGKRFVASSETNAGRTLAEGLVKTITGNE